MYDKNVKNINSNSNNDSRIMELKEQIIKKKNELGKAPSFSPITNCILEYDGIKYNLHATNKTELLLLTLKLNALIMSAYNVGMTDEDIELMVIISGYSIIYWLADIQCKASIIEYDEEKKKLSKMEAKLDKLLTNEKRTSLEIDDIASMLD